MRIVILAIVLAVTPQDKCTLAPKSKKGEKVGVKSQDTMDGKFTITAGEQEQELVMSEKSTLKYSDEVLDVDADGFPSHVMRTFKEWKVEGRKAGEEESSQETKPLEGKTIVIKRKDGKTTFEGAEEATTKDLRKHRLRPSIFFKSLPKGGVTEGDTWDIDEKALLKDFEEDQEGADEGDKITIKSAKARGTLKKVQLGKRSVATIVYEVTGEGEMSRGLKVKLDMKATLELNIDSQQMMSLKGEGTMDVEGDLEQGGQTMKVKGQFKMGGETVWTYE